MNVELGRNMKSDGFLGAVILVSKRFFDPYVQKMSTRTIENRDFFLNNVNLVKSKYLTKMFEKKQTASIEGKH